MMTSTTQANRRTSPRVNVHEMSVFVGSRELYVTGDLSSGGVGFRLDEIVAVGPGDDVRVEFKLPEGMGQLSMTACVKHRRQLPDGAFFVGAAFEPLDELVQNPLDRFVEERDLRFRTPLPIPSLI